MNIYVETYGCTANKSDERLLIGILQQNGHHILPNPKDADVLVLLTCTVIGTTEQRMLSRLQVFRKTEKQIIVSGCMPTVQADLIRSVAPSAVLLPCRHIQYVNDIINGKMPVFIDTIKTSFPKRYDGVIAPILIAEGCRLSCTYCITHVARGSLHSFPVEGVLGDVASALSQGCREIQLTAQDTASYGLDIGLDLSVLLRRITSLDGLFRIRVGMMNPMTTRRILDSLITAYAHDHVYKFLHVPVQSGDDNILKKMNRGYTAQEFIALVRRFRSAFPSLTLSTDVILGFPSETEDQFTHTLQLLQEIRPDIINITRFSARPHTIAKKMKGRIPTHVVKERSRQTTELCLKLTLEKNIQHLGKTYRVLVTEKGKNKTVTGRTENYKQVVLTEAVPLGSVVETMIIDTAPSYLVGKLI